MPSLAFHHKSRRSYASGQIDSSGLLSAQRIPSVLASHTVARRSECEIASESSSEKYRSQDEFDILIRKNVMVSLCASVRDELHTFLGTIVDEFVIPMWTSVSCTSISRKCILPQVCAFPVSRVPASWSESKTGEFLLCKTFSGNWTLVSTSHLSGANINIIVPPRLQTLIGALNCFQASSRTTVLFDEGSREVYASEIEMIRDVLIIYKLDDETASFKLHKSVVALPPGAVHVHGVHNSKLIFTVACSIYVEDLRGRERRRIIPEAIASSSHKDRIPVSVQGVVPCITRFGNILYISEGSVWSSKVAIPHEKRCILRDETVRYVASACDFDSMRCVLVGFGNSPNETVLYLTVLDMYGEFVVSTVSCNTAQYMSIISVAINPVSSDVIILGRCNQAAQHGSISYTLPAVHN